MPSCTRYWKVARIVILVWAIRALTSCLMGSGSGSGLSDDVRLGRGARVVTQSELPEQPGGRERTRRHGQGQHQGLRRQPGGEGLGGGGGGESNPADGG